MHVAASQTVNPRIPREVIDRLMDMYLDWREECIRLGAAYQRWLSVPIEERDLAFAAYIRMNDPARAVFRVRNCGTTSACSRVGSFQFSSSAESSSAWDFSPMF